MRNVYSTRITKDTLEEFVDTVTQYLRAGWRLYDEPDSITNDYVNPNGTTTPRTEYYGCVIWPR